MLSSTGYLITCRVGFVWELNHLLEWMRRILYLFKPRWHPAAIFLKKSNLINEFISLFGALWSIGFKKEKRLLCFVKSRALN